MFTKKFRKRITMMMSVFTAICILCTVFTPTAFARDSVVTTYTGNTAYTYDGFGVSSVSNAVDGSTSTVWSAGYHDRSTPVRIFIDRGATNGSLFFNELNISYSVPNVQGVYVYAGSSLEGTLPSSNTTALASDFDLNYDDRYLVAKDEITELTPDDGVNEINLTFPSCNKRYIIIEQYVSMDFDKTDAYNLAVSDISFIFNDPGDVTGIGAYYKSSNELSGFVANYENDFMFKAHAEHYNGTSYIALVDENLFVWTMDSVTPGTNANTASGADAYDCPSTTPTIDSKTAVITVPKKWYGTFTVKCTAKHDGSSATREYVVHQGNAMTDDVTATTDIAWAASGWGQTGASKLIDNTYNTGNYWSPGAHTGAGNGVTVDLGSSERFNYVDVKVTSWDTAGFKLEAANALSGTAPTASNTASGVVPKTSDSSYQSYTHTLATPKISTANLTSTENLYFPIKTMTGRYARFTNIYGSNADDTSVKSQTLAPRISEVALSYMPASSIKLKVSGSNSTSSSAGYKDGFIKTVTTAGAETAGSAIYYESDGSTKVYIKVDEIKGGFAGSNSPYLSRTIVKSDRSETDPKMLTELKWWLGEDGLYGKNTTSLNGVNLTTNGANDTANLEFTADCVPHTLVLNCAWVDPNKQFRTVIQQMRIPVVYHAIRQYDIDQYYTTNGYGGVTATNALNGIEGLEYSGEGASANVSWAFGAHSVSTAGAYFHTSIMRSAVNKVKLNFSTYNTKRVSIHSLSNAPFPSTTDTTKWRDGSYDTSHQVLASVDPGMDTYVDDEPVNELGSVDFYGSMVNITPTTIGGADRYDLVNGGEFLHFVNVPLNELTTNPYWSVQVKSALANSAGSYENNRLYNIALYKADLADTYLYGIPTSYTPGSYDTETLKPYALSIDDEGDEMKAVTYTWSLTSAPAGVSINSSTGEITFGGTESGTVTVLLSATDGSTTKTASKSFTLNAPVVKNATITVYQSGTSTVLYTTTMDIDSTFALSTAASNITVPANKQLSGFYVGTDGGTLRATSYSFTVTGDTAIYAKFDSIPRTITVYQSGTSTVLWTTTVNQGVSFSLSNVVSNITVPTNKTLSGFYVGTDGGTLQATTASVQITGDTAIYAKFDSIPRTITVYQSGTTTVLYTTTVNQGDTFSLSTAAANITPPANMGLSGFYVGTDNGTLQATSYSFTVTGNTSVYAKFEYGNNTVTVYKSGTSEVLWSTTVTAGSTFSLSTAVSNITVPSNMLLSGFYVGTDGGTLRPASYSFTISGNTSIYAKFEYEEYEIRFVDSSASGLPPTIYGTALDTYAGLYSSKNIASYTPTKSGCRFEGWTKTPGSTTEFNWPATSVTEAITLYPIWYTYQTGANISNVKINGTTATVSGTSYSIDYAFPYSVDKATVLIALASDSTKASITVNGDAVSNGASTSVSLFEGTNTITVVVTPESPEASSSTYTIVIEKLSASDALALEFGDDSVLPSTAGSVATTTIRAGGATVDTDFMGTDITFSFNNTMFSFDPSADIEWNTALGVDTTNTTCTSTASGNITTVTMSLALTDAVNVPAGDYIDLASISLTLLEDVDLNYTLGVPSATYSFDTESDPAEYSNVYSRLIFVVQKPVVTGYEFTSSGAKFSIFSGVTRQTVSVINVTGNDSDPDAPSDYDMENDNVYVTYQWYRDGVPTGVTDSSYTLTTADVGKKIEVKIMITDNDLAQTGYETVTVFNTVFRRGDGNRSGRVDISDAAYLNTLDSNANIDETSSHLYGGGIDDPYKDGQLTALDITSILQKCLYLITDAEYDVLGN